MHPGVRRVAATVELRQAEWEAHNADQHDRTGPLWVALGDSSVVGVGASSIERTATMIVYRNLLAADGRPWRLINLGRYGAKLDEVTRTQLTRVYDWGPPALVTVGAGANDVVWSRGTAATVGAFGRLLDGLPPGTVVGTVPAGWFGKGLRINDWLRQQARHRDLRVAEVGVLPQWRSQVADDGFHPNDDGYRFIADGVMAALGIADPAD